MYLPPAWQFPPTHAAKAFLVLRRAVIVAPKTLLAQWEKELVTCGLGSLLFQYYGSSQADRYPITFNCLGGVHHDMRIHPVRVPPADNESAPQGLLFAPSSDSQRHPPDHLWHGAAQLRCTIIQTDTEARS